MPDTTEQELLALTRKLLDSIAAGDWKTYAELCDPAITCFEPEARGHLVEGLPFHQFYFNLGAPPAPRTTTLASSRVRLMGDAALVTYVRLVQSIGADGAPATSHYDETRVWQRQQGTWRHVHFHRSPCS